MEINNMDKKIIKYNEDGGLRLENNNLTSLKGCPQNLNTGFYCDYNKLASLKGGPKKVIGNFDCSNNQLTSLNECPKEIWGDFVCSGNKISKNDLLDYLKKAKIRKGISTDYGDFDSQSEAIEKLSGTIKENCFNY